MLGLVLDETPIALDNDVFTSWRKGNRPLSQAISDYIRKHKSPPALPSVTVFEAVYGCRKRCDKQGRLDQITQQDLRRTQELAASCAILDFNYAAAEIAAFVCGRLSKNMSKDLMRDVFIASIALAHGHGVATWNRKDFEIIAANLPPENTILRVAAWNR